MAEQAVTIPRRRYLLVDDEAFSRVVVVKILKGLGAASVAEAEDGARALDALAAEPFDCVIADFNMPNMNGLELLKSLRTGHGDIARDVPFVMLTGAADSTTVGFAMQLDVSAFVVKPATKAVLGARLVRIFAERRMAKDPSAYASVAIENAPRMKTLSAAERAAAVAAQDAKIFGGAAASSADGGGAPLDVDCAELRAGDVLADDFLFKGAPLIRRGVRLDDAQARRLHALSDLADLIGPLGPVKILRSA